MCFERPCQSSFFPLLLLIFGCPRGDIESQKFAFAEFFNCVELVFFFEAVRKRRYPEDRHARGRFETRGGSAQKELLMPNKQQDDRKITPGLEKVYVQGLFGKHWHFFPKDLSFGFL